MKNPLRIVRTDTAVILAAGRGSRLAPLTDNLPKCLLSLGRATLIQLQIRHLRGAGIARIVVVTGYCEDKVRSACGSNVEYIHNRAFEKTNSLYSLMKARRLVQKGCLVLNSDVVFHPRLLSLLLESPHPDALLVDFRSNLGEEEMKVIVQEGRIKGLSKDIAPWEAQGENVGVLKLSPEGGTLLMRTALTAARNGQKKLWVPQGISQIVSKHPFFAVPTQELPWIEVDYLHDLERARNVIYPQCR